MKDILRSNSFYDLFLLPNGGSPVDVWFELHALERLWENSFLRAKRFGQLELLDNAVEEHRKIAQKLALFPSERWVQFSGSVGWTSMSASALSWCKDSNLDTVLRIWRNLKVPTAAEVGRDLPSRLLNPDFLPESKMSVLMKVAPDPRSLSYLIAARNERPVMDIEKSTWSKFPPGLQMLIASRT